MDDSIWMVQYCFSFLGLAVCHTIIQAVALAASHALMRPSLMAFKSNRAKTAPSVAGRALIAMMATEIAFFAFNTLALWAISAAFFVISLATCIAFIAFLAAMVAWMMAEKLQCRS